MSIMYLPSTNLNFLQYATKFSLKHFLFISGGSHFCCQGKQVLLETSNQRSVRKRHWSYRDWFPGSYRHLVVGQMWSFPPSWVKRGHFSVIFQPWDEAFLYWTFRTRCSRGKFSTRWNNVTFRSNPNWLWTPRVASQLSWIVVIVVKSEFKFLLKRAYKRNEWSTVEYIIIDRFGQINQLQFNFELESTSSNGEKLNATVITIK